MLNGPLPATLGYSRVHIDHFFFDNNICLIAVDALTKYIECEIVRTTSVTDTIDALNSIFSRNGLCDTIVSDNACCFTAQEFQNFLKSKGINHITPPPYSPASNGQAERGVGVIKGLLKKGDINDSFKSRLAKALLQYRTVPHSVTQVVPSVSLNNRKLITNRDRINPKYCSSNCTNNKYVKQFQVGDLVQALNLRSGEKWLKGTIVEQLAVNIYNVLIHDYNIIWKRHCNQLLSLKVNSPDVKGLENIKIQGATIPESIVIPPNYIIPNADVCVENVPNVQNENTMSNDTNLRRSTRIRKPVSRYMFDD